jgi:hypothetical protein
MTAAVVVVIACVICLVAIFVAAWALDRADAEKVRRIGAELRLATAIRERDAEKREHAKTADALVREQQARAAGEARWQLACVVCKTVAAPSRITVSSSN